MKDVICLNILKELCKGNIKPSEKSIKKEGQYDEIFNQLIDDIDKLKVSLNKEEKVLLDKILDMEISLNCISEEENFIDGFCTGIKMILEVLNYKSENFI